MVALVHEINGGEVLPTPPWLQRAGKAEARRRWPLIQRIYHELSGLHLPDVMPPRESRTLDAIFKKRGQPCRAFEVDEKQHFNHYRANTLRAYPRSVRLAFPKQDWIERGDAKRSLEKGGFGVAKPPLFPGDEGRHQQRAFRDALADILPLAYDWLPTLRVAHFEVEPWIWGADAKRRMRKLLAERL